MKFWLKVRFEVRVGSFEQWVCVQEAIDGRLNVDLGYLGVSHKSLAGY